MTRRVVTGPAGYASDGPAPNTIDVPDGAAVTELLWLDGPPATAADGRERDDGGWPLEPPAGGLSSRIIRMPAGTSYDMHATDTLDLMVVLDGEIVMGLPGGEHVVRAGNCVVQRGTEHSWKVAGDQPCTYFVTMLRPTGGPAPAALGSSSGDSGVRRFVTRPDGGVDVNDAPVGIAGGSTRIIDIWHTGGPVASVTQGGDPGGPFELEPPAGGTWLRIIELAPPEGDLDAHWHTTRSIDIDVVLQGRVAHDLREGGTVELGPGDALIQRETEHRWRALTDDFRMASVMLELTA